MGGLALPSEAGKEQPGTVNHTVAEKFVEPLRERLPQVPQCQREKRLKEGLHYFVGLSARGAHSPLPGGNDLRKGLSEVTQFNLQWKRKQLLFCHLKITKLLTNSLSSSLRWRLTRRRTSALKAKMRSRFVYVRELKKTLPFSR